MMKLNLFLGLRIVQLLIHATILTIVCYNSIEIRGKPYRPKTVLIFSSQHNRAQAEK